MDPGVVGQEPGQFAEDFEHHRRASFLICQEAAVFGQPVQLSTQPDRVFSFRFRPSDLFRKGLGHQSLPVERNVDRRSRERHGEAPKQRVERGPRPRPLLMFRGR